MSPPPPCSNTANLFSISSILVVCPFTIKVRFSIFVLFVCICCFSASVIPEPLPPEPPLFSKFVTLVFKLAMSVLFVRICCFSSSVIPEPPELPPPFSRFVTLVVKLNMFVEFVLIRVLLLDTFVFKLLMSCVFCSSCCFCSSVIPPLEPLELFSRFVTLWSNLAVSSLVSLIVLSCIPTLVIRLFILAVFVFTLAFRLDTAVFNFSISLLLSSAFLSVSFIFSLVPSIVTLYLSFS